MRISDWSSYVCSSDLIGAHFGSGADLPEQAEMFSAGADYSLLSEFKIPDDADVKYPPKNSYRYLSSLTQLYANSNFGLRSLQDFKKISIVEVKGYCYGRSEEHTSELQSLMRISYAVFCLKKKKKKKKYRESDVMIIKTNKRTT